MTSSAALFEVAIAAMGTVFVVQAPQGDAAADDTARRELVTAALDIAREVEATCSRFDPASELSRLSATVGEAVPVSPLLFELLVLARAVADASEGAFDPTVGRHVAALGFVRRWSDDRDRPLPAAGPASWRDVHCDRATHTVTLRRPLHLDLGAIAKGFAVDLIVAALEPMPHCLVDAGGDVRCHGAHPDGRPWRIGIRDPFRAAGVIAEAELVEGALCTSGVSERRTDRGHHLVEPRTGRPVRGWQSLSVAAPTAAMADALATAAFVRGPFDGLAWCATQGVDACAVHDDGRIETAPAAGIARWIVPDAVAF